MRIAKRAQRRWTGDEAASVAVAAAGGLMAALFVMALAIGELAGLMHEQFALIPH